MRFSCHRPPLIYHQQSNSIKMEYTISDVQHRATSSFKNDVCDVGNIEDERYQFHDQSRARVSRS